MKLLIRNTHIHSLVVLQALEHIHTYIPHNNTYVHGNSSPWFMFGKNDIAVLYLLICQSFKLIFKTLKSESVATPFLVDYK